MPQRVPAAATAGEGILQALPKLPDLPASLFAPAPPPSPGHNPLDVPYFVPDPLLDVPEWPPPGWFAGLELGVLKPHLENKLTNTVQNAVQAANGTSTTVALPSASLDWTVSPKVVFGYRLPSGFGEVSFAYRGLGTRGSADIAGADGPGTLHSRLDFNVLDFDYNSREFSLWPHWTMRWTFGVRALFVFFDSQADQPFVQAAAGSGIFQMREGSHLSAVGPHAGLELTRCVGDTGLTLTLRTDFTTDLARVHETYLTRSTTLGPDGQPLAGVTADAHWWNTPIVNVQVGLGWQPPGWSAARFFLGYQYEHWWRVGGNLDTGARANLWDQGIVLQAAFRF
jgi:hypothetical protein